MKPRVYLAGPIKGLEYGDSVAWREVMQVALAPEIEAFSPMRGKSALRSLDGPLGSEYGDEFMLLCSPRAIVTRDRFDVVRADLVIVNLSGAEHVSIGTMFEIAWSSLRGIPVVIIDDYSTDTHRHPFVTECADWIVGDLEDAAHVARSVLLS